MRNITNKIVCVIVLTFAGFTCANARAEEPLFPKGKWDIELDGFYTAPIRFSHEYPAGGEIGVGYYLFDNFAAIVSGSGFVIGQDVEDATGGSVNASLRWHIFRLDRFSLFIDGGGGRMWLDEASRPGGTTYNWIGRVGGGITYRLSDHWDLIGGARYYHYSNGDEHGRAKNPGFDGIQFFGGVMYSF
jgi:hypothetical protein